MKIERGNGKTEYGYGINIKLTKDEVCRAIDSWLVGQGVYIVGSRTTRIDNNLCDIYVDPSAYVNTDNGTISGRTGFFV